MIRLYELHPEAAQVHGLSVLHHLALRALEQVVLFQLVLNQGNGQLGSVHRHIHLLQNIGQGPDMVLVAVGDDKSLDLLNVLF